MDDRAHQSDHEELIARSRAARRQAREVIANAKATIARSRAIVDHLEKRSPHELFVEAE